MDRIERDDLRDESQSADADAPARGGSIILAYGRPDTADLKEYDGNARRGNVDGITQSLIANGAYKPIVVNRGSLTGRRNEVLAGNHTLMAAIKIGWDKIDAAFVDVDDDQARKINLVDNKTNDDADYDDDALKALLAECGEDLVGTGYTQADVDKMFNDATGDDEGDGDPGMGELEFRVIVDCRDEEHQADLLSRFDAEGLTCRPLIS